MSTPTPAPSQPSPTVQLAIKELAGIPDPATRVAQAYLDIAALEDAFAVACKVLWDQRGHTGARSLAKELGIPTSRLAVGIARAEQLAVAERAAQL